MGNGNTIQSLCAPKKAIELNTELLHLWECTTMVHSKVCLLFAGVLYLRLSSLLDCLIAFFLSCLLGCFCDCLLFCLLAFLLACFLACYLLVFLQP